MHLEFCWGRYLGKKFDLYGVLVKEARFLCELLVMELDAPAQTAVTTASVAYVAKALLAFPNQNQDRVSRCRCRCCSTNGNIRTRRKRPIERVGQRLRRTMQQQLIWNSLRAIHIGCLRNMQNRFIRRMAFNS
jgi:hypothetical protein